MSETTEAAQTTPHIPTDVKIEELSINDLIIDEPGSNPRIHSKENRDLIDASLEEIKPWRSVAIDENNRLVAGSGTVDSAARKGFDRVIVVDAPPGALIAVRRGDLSEEKKKRYAVLDNLGSDVSHFDSMIIDRMRDDGLTEGFDDLLARQMARQDMWLTSSDGDGGDGDDGDGNPEPRIDEAAALVAKWGVKPGQIWEIPSMTARGESHYLMCGFSDKADHVVELMNGQRAKLFATDPPYLVSYDGTNHAHQWKNPSKAAPTVEELDDANLVEMPHDPEAIVVVSDSEWQRDHYGDWDDLTLEEGQTLYRNFMQVAKDHAIDSHAAWYCWHASKFEMYVEQIWIEMGAFKHCQIVWKKDRPILTRTWYMWQHEPCLMGWVKGNMPKRARKEYLRTVWDIPTIPAGHSGLHPTEKPVRLFEIPAEQHLRPGEIAYEPFSGSGSQLVACENTRALCYAMEKNPRFVAIALQRMEDAGLKPSVEREIGVDLSLWHSKSGKDATA